MSITDECTFLHQLDRVLVNADIGRTDDQIVAAVTRLVHERINALNQEENEPTPPFTTEQFDALKRWVERVAYEAAGDAIHQPRAKDNGPEQNAREALTGEYRAEAG